MGKSGSIRKAAAAAAAAGLIIGAKPIDPKEKAVRETVAAQLKDPDSAEFKGIKETSPGYWCGWVNAKNAYGGYVGYSVFFYHDGKASITPPELSDVKLC